MSRRELRALGRRVRAWQDDLERQAHERGLDVLRIGVEPGEEPARVARIRHGTEAAEGMRHASGIKDWDWAIRDATGITLMLAILTPSRRAQAADPTDRHDPRPRASPTSPPTRRGRRGADRVLVEDRSQRGAGRREVHAHADVRGARHRACEGRGRRVEPRAVGPASGAVRDRRRPAVPRHSQCAATSSSSTSTRCACSARSSSARKSRCRGCRLAIACRTRCKEARRCRAGNRSIRWSRCRSGCCRSCRPASADIRDTPVETFGDVDARLFRSNLLLIVAGVAFVLAGLMALMLVARAAVKRRATARRGSGRCRAFAVLRAAFARASRRAAASQSEWLEWRSRRAGGRGVAAGRRRRAVASGRPERSRPRDAADRRTGRGGAGVEALRGKKDVLSASVTPRLDGVERHALRQRSELWRALSQPLGRVHGRPVQPGRQPSTATALDAALAEARDVVRRLRLRQWRRFGRTKRHAEPPCRTTDMGTLNALIELVRAHAERVAAAAHRRSGVQRAQCGAAGVRAAGGARGNRAGLAIDARPAAGPHRDCVAGGSAALRQVAARVRAPRAVRAVSRGPAVLLSRARRSVLVAVGAPGVVSGPAHRGHHGRVAQHAVAVQRPAAEDAERHGVLEHDGGGGVFHPRAHEGETIAI